MGSLSSSPGRCAEDFSRNSALPAHGRHCDRQMTMRRILLILLPLACIAQETGPVSSLKLKILDLQFRVEDMGGKVEDLHIKETATEVRVEMAADILFDFDKAVLKPQAESALRQVAALIAGRGKGPVRVA